MINRASVLTEMSHELRPAIEPFKTETTLRPASLSKRPILIHPPVLDSGVWLMARLGFGMHLANVNL